MKEECMMSDQEKPEALGEIPEQKIWLFDVLPDTDEIAVADYAPDFNRYTAYDGCPDDLRFGESFIWLLMRSDALRDVIYRFSLEAEDDREALDDWDTEDGYGYGFGHAGVGVPGTILIIVVILILLGRI